jgi:peptidoglycan/LPS O-acetylase OafA/YrhL
MWRRTIGSNPANVSYSGGEMMPRQPRLLYLPQLDGLRAVAIGLVLLAHFPPPASYDMTAKIWLMMQSLRPAYIGVDIFFVLSGFLITRILLQEKRSFGRINIRAFYIRRALRIFPIFYMTLFFCTIYFRLTAQDVIVFAAYAANLSLLPVATPLDHTWSLAVEEQFYLVWPLLLHFLPLRYGDFVTKYAMPGLALLAAATIAIGDPGAQGAAFINELPVTRMLSLAFGANLAVRQLDGREIPQRISLALGALGILILGGTLAGRTMGIIVYEASYWVFATLGFAVLSFGIVSCCVFAGDGPAPAGFMVRVLCAASVRYIGRISYGLYLYHYPILYMYGLHDKQIAATGSNGKLLLAALFTTVVFASLSYHFVESPILRLKSRVGQANPASLQEANSADSVTQAR